MNILDKYVFTIKPFEPIKMLLRYIYDFLSVYSCCTDIPTVRVIQWKRHFTFRWVFALV